MGARVAALVMTGGWACADAVNVRAATVGLRTAATTGTRACAVAVAVTATTVAAPLTIGDCAPAVEVAELSPR